ncbi:alpha/beta hydrolase [Tamlana sp. I1]|uniref:alpha/beta hydrolase n=1 Tax=Tamlana sp. I1 TaxID=2762061 RepID=UPI00188EFF28|nr:alpha/beta hydrolase [Tamlana sp. I1]
MIRTFGISSFIALSSIFNCTSQSTTYKPVKFPTDYNASLNIVYTTVNQWEGKMDLYTNLLSKQPTPIVINIHGGGWNHGVKESQTGFSEFFKNGFAVANVEYRLESTAPAPAAIEDVRCALIYLYKHAKTLNIDTNKIVVMGASAGGHLALMTGLLGNNRRFDSHCYLESEIKIAAIIDKYGPTDLTLLSEMGSAKKWLKTNSKNKTFIKSVSPLYFVSESSPPTLIIHGTKDPLVSYKQSVMLYKKLQENQIKTELVLIEGGGHGKFSKAEKSLFNEKLWQFLDNLKLTNKN